MSLVFNKKFICVRNIYSHISYTKNGRLLVDSEDSINLVEVENLKELRLITGT